MNNYDMLDSTRRPLGVSDSKMVAGRSRARNRGILCHALWLWLAALFIPAISPAETITLVADEWPPFNIKPDSAPEGYLVDIARRVFAARGHTVVYKTVPWKRAIESTRAGLYDGAIGASKRDAEGFVFPSEELARDRLAFYVRAGSPWRFCGLPSLADVRLGTILGYDYRAWLNSYLLDNRDNAQKVQILTGDEPLKRNLIKLVNGRIDVVVDTEAAILYVAKQLGITGKIECAGYDAEPADIYIAFSPNKPGSAAYAQILSEGVARLRKSGELQKILDTYGLHDWK